MRRHFNASQRGLALVVTLGFLVLLSVLVVAFFASVETELKTSKSYESSTTVNQLASSVTHLVTGQIVDATRSTKIPVAAETPNTLPPGGRLSWASQPGMIRTWDDQGHGWKIFKLYSDRDMVVGFDSDGTYATGTKRVAEIPATWSAQSAIFTDLNQPVLVEESGGPIRRDSRSYRADWPIVDPNALLPTASSNKVDGFSITLPPGYAGPTDGTGSPQFDNTTDPTVFSLGRTNNPAPMPVQWIYVLKDGTLTAPTGNQDGGRTALWSADAAARPPSRDNPIVGRVAFWTDDETSKLNLNTASEPTPWDTPRAVTVQDLQYGRSQPAQHEYQRSPGHPFMTALSPVLFPGTTPTTQQKEAIYGVIPRVQPGGSMGGTKIVSAVVSGISIDGDRLFANSDEFLFGPGGRKPLSEDTRFTELNFNQERLRRGRFFLTANSSAPEINLYGQPRISLWPVPQVVNSRTAFDRMAAFCTTISGSSTLAYPFYFQRRDASDPTLDWTGIPRNQDLYGYLQHLTSTAVPGFGGTFLEKWQGDRDQILTEMFDYIRCTNLWDFQAGATKFAPRGQVAPIQILNDPAGKSINTQGFGRFHTISQFVLHFICTQQGAAGLSTVAKSGQPALGANQRAIEAALYLEPFSPALGYSKIEEQVFYEISFKDPLSVDGNQVEFVENPTGKLDNSIASVTHASGRQRGGPGGIRGPIKGFGAANYSLANTNSTRIVINTSADKKTMKLTGGQIDVIVHAGTNVSGPVIQTFHIQIPEKEIPVPDLVTTGTGQGRGVEATAASYWWTFKTRLSAPNEVPYLPSDVDYPTNKNHSWGTDSEGYAPGFKMGSIIRKEDVVRALVPKHGDIRLIAAQAEVNDLNFVEVADWTSANKIQHIISEAAGTQFMYGNGNEPGVTSGAEDQLRGSANVKDHWARLPEIRPGAGKLFNRWGDFDNGVAMWTDGSFINKPDEGNFAETRDIAYFDYHITDPTEKMFNPNRLVPSAGMFGSLPTGVKRHDNSAAAAPTDWHAWETLLFRPQAGHPGQAAGFPKDHLIMDLFWMPVIEPYPISEPFSTAGKINLNYEIAPFDYIRRATPLYGVMKSEEPLLLPNNASSIYKLWNHEVNDAGYLPSNTKTKDATVRADWTKLYNGTAPFDKLRRPIDMEQTLAQFEDRFKKGEIFRSATQICELHLVRQGETLQQYESGTIWPNNLITGDNTRERPYANLYARLTTRSNSYTVHMRVQVLRQTGGTTNDWATWREGKDVQLSEYRGSSLVERYIDPGDLNLADYTKNPNAVVDRAYKMRVVSSRKFAP